MLKRGFIILLQAGYCIFSWVFCRSIYARKHSFSQTIVRASESVDATLQVNDTTRPISVVLHSGLESINVTLRESIRDPNGRIVNTNEFSKDFFTTFKPNMTGEYTLNFNLGPNDINIDEYSVHTI
jgi:hypothetical protein